MSNSDAWFGAAASAKILAASSSQEFSPVLFMPPEVKAKLIQYRQSSR
ncbi:hypothetical protein [Oscillatoria sp. HE19RPO]|nr:hypothetical protein [Oscillatoria sp. HE19RPO]